MLLLPSFELIFIIFVRNSSFRIIQQTGGNVFWKFSQRVISFHNVHIFQCFTNDFEAVHSVYDSYFMHSFVFEINFIYISYYVFILMLWGAGRQRRPKSQRRQASGKGSQLIPN